MVSASLTHRCAPRLVGSRLLTPAVLVPGNFFSQPAGAVLTVMLPVAVPSAAAVANFSSVLLTAVTRCSPFSAAMLLPATRITEFSRLPFLASLGKVSVATPPATTREVALRRPKPVHRQ